MIKSSTLWIKRHIWVTIGMVCVLTFIYYYSGRESGKNKIIALGDSLTAGMYDKTQSHPYTTHLARLMKRNISFENFEVINAGVRGERARNMRIRLSPLLEKIPKIKLVIILAGTNDYMDLIRGKNMPENRTAVDYSKRSSEIFKDIKSLHLMCFQKNIATVTMSIPPLKWEEENEYSKYKIHRENINSKLRRFAEQDAPSLTSFLDLSTAVELVSLNSIKSVYFWDDAVHYTAYGYDLMAKWLYNHIVEHVQLKDTTITET